MAGAEAGKHTRTAPTSDQIQLNNERHVEAICRRHLDRGFKSPKVADAGFRNNVLSAFDA
ncbi:hypothetical protein AbraIFM66951_009555 [Aspergillus brasiliensis]|nr:hypothetical protein AbraIFM66950_000357 [Aspergillus brasiliensis]GKZ41445.1 hypothetical protein AbraIFM66951_009555 [Aspergillus brasiliensis]